MHFKVLEYFPIPKWGNVSKTRKAIKYKVVHYFYLFGIHIFTLKNILHFDKSHLKSATITTLLIFLLLDLINIHV